MRPAYYRQVHRPRQRQQARVASRPGTGDSYIIRESSPYSLASMEGLDGWASIRKSITKPFKQAAAVVKKAGSQAVSEVVKPVAAMAWKGTKQVVAFQANLYTLGAAGKFTSISKWSGAGRAGKAGTVAGFAAAAIAGGYLAAGALAPAAAPVSASAATGAAVASGAPVASSAGGWLGAIATGAKAAGALAPLAIMGLKASGVMPNTVAPTTMSYGSGGGYDTGGLPFSAGGGGGGGGGGYTPPGAEGAPGIDSRLWPLLIVGGLGVVLLSQRRS